MASLISTAQSAIFALLDGGKGAQYVNDLDQRSSPSLNHVKAGSLLKALKDLVVGIDATQESKSVQFVYDFAGQGGAVSAITMSGTALPAGAIVTKSWVEIKTTVTSGGAATLAFGFSGAAAAVLAATAKTSFGAGFGPATVQDDGLVAHFIAGATAGGKKPIMTIGTADLTAGKVILHVEYTVGA